MILDDRARNEEENENAKQEKIPRNPIDQLQLLMEYLNSNAGAMRNWKLSWEFL